MLTRLGQTWNRILLISANQTDLIHGCPFRHSSEGDICGNPRKVATHVSISSPRMVKRTLTLHHSSGDTHTSVAKVGEVSNVAQVAQVCKGKWQKDKVRSYPHKVSVLYRQEL